MDAVKRTRLVSWIKSVLFTTGLITVVIGLVWLSTRYNYRADWTASGRNTLSAASIALLEKIDAPVTITAYASETPILRRFIKELVQRYQQFQPTITLVYVDPNAEPQKILNEGITMDGQLVVELRGKRQRVPSLTEANLTNTLFRVMRENQGWVLFLTGHGERDPYGDGNYDVGIWGKELRAKGVQVQTLNLARVPLIPENTAALVIAGPQVKLLPGEVAQINDYLGRGGNMLWLTEPEDRSGLDALAETLGVRFPPGTIVDPTTSRMSVDNPAFALSDSYGKHDIVAGFKLITVYPYAVGVQVETTENWQVATIVATSTESWSETDPLDGDVSFDKMMDVRGPLQIGVAMERKLERHVGSKESEMENVEVKPSRKQRVVVFGDGDFLSNTYVGNGGNLDLGLRVINWLTMNDELIAIPPKTSPDRGLTLSNAQLGVMGFGFLLFLPVGLLLIGVFIGWWRKRR